MNSKRIYLFDNLKGALILLVVLAHFLIPVANGGGINAILFQMIYLFHMPFFIFISGLFAKGIYRDGRFRYERVLSLLVLAFAYQLTLQLIDGKEMRNLVEFESAPWYLISLCSWYLLVPLISSLRPVVAVIGAFALSVMSGYFVSGGDFLAIERTIVFLPWFVLGFFCDPKRLSAFVAGIKPAVRAPAFLLSILVGLAAVGICSWFDCFYLVYGTSSYSSRFLVGATERVLLFLVAFIMSSGLTMICPNRKIALLTKLGENSLQVYVIHRLLRGLLQNCTGFYEMDVLYGVSGTVLFLIISIAISAILSSDFFRRPFDYIIEYKWRPASRA